MAEKALKRKLTAILSADVEGYSRLMGDDEESTIRTLTNYRSAMTSLIQKHRGRVVDAPGDNLLAEFSSAVHAVTGAVEIQRELAGRNTELSDERKMNFRIGVNVGDVVTVGDSSGEVIRIRIRATTIRDFDGKELLVPNKEFVTGRLLNWTLSDTSIRYTLCHDDS